MSCLQMNQNSPVGSQGGAEKRPEDENTLKLEIGLHPFSRIVFPLTCSCELNAPYMAYAQRMPNIAASNLWPSDGSLSEIPVKAMIFSLIEENHQRLDIQLEFITTKKSPQCPMVRITNSYEQNLQTEGYLFF